MPARKWCGFKERRGRVLRRQRRAFPGRPVDVLVHDAHRPPEIAFALAHLAPVARFVNYEALARSALFDDAPVVEFAWFRAP